MKLISMTDFVLDQDITLSDSKFKILKYANFLKQPLTLGMFVPCDENGNVLEEPKHYELWRKYGDFTQYGTLITPKCIEYQQAKERVLFEGFYVEFNAVISPSGGYLDVGNLRHKTIETIVGASLTLTPYALKQIGL